MKPIRGVILDVDGTLVDSNEAHARAWSDAFVEHGRNISFQQVLPLIGMGGDKLVPELTGLDAEEGEGKSITDRRKVIFRERYLPAVQGFPQVRQLLQRLKQDGFELAVASSASEEELQPLLKKAQADDLIEEKTSSDDAEKSKPDPDILHAALARAGLKADEALMLGDTPYDIEAARKAGLRILAVRCGGWQDADLKGALRIFDDPADLLAHYTQVFR